MSDHIATFERMLESRYWATPDEQAAITAAIALMRGQSEAAEKWALCTTDHELPDGTTVKPHVLVGVNLWRGESWISFDQMNYADFAEVLADCMSIPPKDPADEQ